MSRHTSSTRTAPSLKKRSRARQASNVVPFGRAAIQPTPSSETAEDSARLLAGLLALTEDQRMTVWILVEQPGLLDGVERIIDVLSEGFPVTR